MQSYNIKNCRICKSKLTKVLEIPKTPIGDLYYKKIIKEQNKKYSLDLMFCPRCYAGQICTVVNPRLLYKNFVYRSSISQGLEKHFQKLANKIIKNFKLSLNDYIFDIGSNDGLLLSFFKKNNQKVLGVDPAKEIAKIASEKGIPTLGKMFDENLSKSISKKYGKAKIIFSNNTMANIDNLSIFLKGIKNILNTNGTFIFETGSFDALLKKKLFDVIYHEHLTYFSTNSLSMLFEKHGLKLYDIEKIPTKGGSLRGYVSHIESKKILTIRLKKMLNFEGNLKTFNENINIFRKFLIKHKTLINKFIERLKNKNVSIAGYGASVGSTTFLYFFGLGKKINFLIDDNKYKNLKYSPGYNLLVKNKKQIKSKKNLAILIISWRYAKIIRNSIKKAFKKNNVIVYEIFPKIKKVYEKH
jgi:SAM-dependent methyltransferase